MKKSIIKTKLSFHRQTLILILLAFSSLLFAQQRTISGTVLDENNESMIGVNIIISGTTTGTITDVDGNYTLTASADDQLVFSYVGYQEQIIPVGDQVRIDISMAPSYSSLDEVVVIGYGTVKRSDLTGSVASVNVDELAKEPVANISQALSGRATGVQVNMASGGPGAEPVVVIRGNNSLNAGNSPLWVVDGFINTNGATNINPNDIESMEILKDASATAIYGSRGANGVIIVTTKKGSQGKTSFSYIGQFSMQKPSKEFDLMSGHETWEYWHAYDKHFGLDALPPNFWKINPEAIDTTNNADWVNEMVRDPAFMQSHYLSATGGTEKVTYNVSFDYLNQEGMMDHASDYQRYNFRTNLTFELSKRLKGGTNIYFRRQERRDGSDGGTYLSTLQRSPLVLPYNEDGSYNYYLDPFVPTAVSPNPIQKLKESDNLQKNNNVNLQGYLNLKLLEGLIFTTEFNNSWYNGWNYKYTPSTVDEATPASTEHSETSKLEWVNRLNFNKTISDNHNVDLMIGSTIENVTRNSVSAGNKYFPSDGFKWYNLDQGQPLELDDKSMESGYDTDRGASFLGRANYNFSNRYYVTFTGRYDGTSKFRGDNRWQFYPSAAISWRLSEEEFIQNLGIFHRLKLRASYGVAGNSDVDDFIYNALMKPIYPDQGLIRFGDVNMLGYTPENFPNPYITWESTSTLDIGVDWGLFGDRLRGSVDYYKKVTNDLLYIKALPPETGYGDMWDNIGSLENWGLEFNIGADLVRVNKFNWQTELNLSLNRNKVLDLGEDEKIPQTSKQYEETIFLEVGQPTSVFYTYVFDGIWQTKEEINENPSRPSDIPGMPRYKDVNGDGQISSDDKELVGNPHPKIIYGWNNVISWGNFTFSIFFQGMYGHDLFNNTKRSLFDRAAFRNDYWRLKDPSDPSLGGTTNEQPLPGAEGLFIDNTYLEKGSYLRLKNLSINYSLPVNLVNKIGMKGLSVYLTGHDLFTFTNYSGMNPEANRSGGSSTRMGIDYSTYPIVKTYMIGVNVTF